jgi:hypothetical protein
MANTGKSGNQPAANIASDLRDRNAQVNGGFYNFEGAPVMKGSLCIGCHNVTTEYHNLFSQNFPDFLRLGGRFRTLPYFGEALPRG